MTRRDVGVPKLDTLLAEAKKLGAIVHEYTPEEATTFMLALRHFGPWE